jgi:ABC-type branched-subunit amino acid transport system substrate-binding protein
MRVKHATAGMLAALLVTGVLAGCGGDDDNNGTTAAAGSGAAATTTTAAAANAIDPSKGEVHFALVAIGPPVATVYNQYGTGADAAANAINAQGGFGGRKVVIDKCNSMLQAAAASVCAHKTIAEKPVAMFGCEIVWAGSGLPIYKKAGIPSFNCANSTIDLKDPTSFDVKAGGNFGYFRAAAKYACSRSDVKKVVAVTLDLPQNHAAVPDAIKPILGGCGKTSSTFYVAPTAVDITPSANQIAKAKPDFVITQITEPATIQLFKAFQSSSYPAANVAVPEGGCSAKMIGEGGSAMDGMWCVSSHKPWTDSGDPEVASYIKAVQAIGKDYKDPSIEYGYSDIMLFYTAAKEIGFDTFNSQTLMDYMNTKSGVHIPVSADLVTPGPQGFEQVKMPYQYVYQWKGGTFEMAQVGDNGVINAYGDQ